METGGCSVSGVVILEVEAFFFLGGARGRAGGPITVTLGVTGLVTVELLLVNLADTMTGLLLGTMSGMTEMLLLLFPSLWTLLESHSTTLKG